MIVDFREDFDTARLYSVIAADTGECLDPEHIFRADDVAGVYRQYVTDADGSLSVDMETHEITTREVRRSIRLVPKPICCWCTIELLPDERFACGECRRAAERLGSPVERMHRTNYLPPRVARGLGL